MVVSCAVINLVVLNGMNAGRSIGSGSITAVIKKTKHPHAYDPLDDGTFLFPFAAA